jgi:hypothetical protein
VRAGPEDHYERESDGEYRYFDDSLIDGEGAGLLQLVSGQRHGHYRHDENQRLPAQDPPAAPGIWRDDHGGDLRDEQGNEANRYASKSDEV